VQLTPPHVTVAAYYPPVSGEQPGFRTAPSPQQDLPSTHAIETLTYQCCFLPLLFRLGYVLSSTVDLSIGAPLVYLTLTDPNCPSVDLLPARPCLS